MLRSKDTWGERNEKYDEYYFWKFNHTHKKKPPKKAFILSSHLVSHRDADTFFFLYQECARNDCQYPEKNKADCYIRVKKLTLDFIKI